MRQVKFAQRCANVNAVVRNAAFVAVAAVIRSLSHLHTHLTGTTSKSKWGISPEIYPECRYEDSGRYWGYRSSMRPAMQPVTCPTTTRSPS